MTGLTIKTYNALKPSDPHAARNTTLPLWVFKKPMQHNDFNVMLKIYLSEIVSNYDVGENSSDTEKWKCIGVFQIHLWDLGSKKQKRHKIDSACSIWKNLFFKSSDLLNSRHCSALIFETCIILSASWLPGFNSMAVIILNPPIRNPRPVHILLHAYPNWGKILTLFYQQVQISLKRCCFFLRIFITTSKHQKKFKATR